MKVIYLVKLYIEGADASRILGAYDKESIARHYVDNLNIVSECKARFAEYCKFKAEILEREGKDNQLFLERYSYMDLEYREWAIVVPTLYHESVDCFISPESKL